jgi:predicted amidohydrolase YtcJ
MTRQLLTGATVWAGANCVPQPAWLLIDDDHITAVGHPDQPPPATDQVVDQVLDLAGCHVLPGFVDVHLHLSQAAWFPVGGDGSAWQSLADALQAVRVAASATTEAQAPWLLFWSVARWRWPEGRLPTAAELDAAAPGRRVLVSTLDMHRGAISSAGLATLGFGLDPDGHARWRATFGDDLTTDRRGRPTGELWEAAYSLALQRALADTLAHADQADEAGQDGQAALQAEATGCPHRRPGRRHRRGGLLPARLPAPLRRHAAGRTGRPVSDRARRAAAAAGGRAVGAQLRLSLRAAGPVAHLRAAVTRRLPGGPGGHGQRPQPQPQLQLQPAQALTPAEAIRAATVAAAASLQAPGAGGLAPGEVADFVVCDGDPLDAGTRVVQTWIGGKLAWQLPDGPSRLPPSSPTTRPSATPP